MSRASGLRWFGQRGGVNPRLRETHGKTRPRLSPLEREEIRVGTVCHEFGTLDRAPAGAGALDDHARHRQQRPLQRGPGRYRAGIEFGADRGGWDAQSGYRSLSCPGPQRAARASAPRWASWTATPSCAEVVEDLLKRKYSPEQIAGRLPEIYPDRPEMRVSHETIYKHYYKHYDRLYVQGRGRLRAELRSCLRNGGCGANPENAAVATETRGRIPGMVNIAERRPRPTTARCPAAGKAI